MEGFLLGGAITILAFFAMQSYQILVGDEGDLAERFRTKRGASIAAMVVTALVYWALRDTGLQTDESFVFAFLMWATFSTLGALHHELYRSILYDLHEYRPGVTIVPLGTTAIVGALLLVTMNVGAGIKLMTVRPQPYNLVLWGTLLTGAAFLGVGLSHWLKGRGAAPFLAADAWRRYRRPIVGMTAALMVLGAWVVLTDGPRKAAAMQEPPIETSLVRVRYLSLEAEDGVPILRFSTDPRRGDPFYVIRYDDSRADLVELSALLQVQYKERHGADREVVDLEVLPRP